MAAGIPKGKSGRAGKSGGGIATLKITWNDNELRSNIEELDDRVKRAMAGTMLQLAPRAEAWMKGHAPWQDQTGNARSGLTSRPEIIDNGKVARLICAHSVPYGIWLEVRWSGRYQIIQPAIQKFGPEAMTTVGRLLDL